MTTAPDKVLRFVAPSGERSSWTVHGTAEETTDPAGLPTRLLTVDGGQQAVQKLVPSDLPTWLPDAYDLLENEIRAGMRLARRYARSYPAELARLIGYDADAEQPFLLMTAPCGEPVDAVAGQLLLAEQRAFEASLFRGLLLLAEADLVHGNLTPRTVRWDREQATVQIGDFGFSAARGEPRRRHNAGGWISAEQRAGTGVAIPADDVWAGGMLLYHVVTGRRPAAQAGPPDLTDRGTALRTVLDGVFADSADGRPDAAEILRRMRADTTVPAGSVGPDPAFEEGARRFEEARRSKHPPAATPDPPPAPAPRNRGLAAGLAAAAVVAVIVVVIVLIV